MSSLSKVNVQAFCVDNDKAKPDEASEANQENLGRRLHVATS